MSHLNFIEKILKKTRFLHSAPEMRGFGRNDKLCYFQISLINQVKILNTTNNIKTYFPGIALF